jgi:hypothetical protein
MAGDQLGNLTDVYLEQPLANDLSHRGMVARACGATVGPKSET